MCFRTAAMAVYKVKLATPEGEEHEFEAPDDSNIQDAAETAGMELPYSCRAGACSTCAGQIAEGSVDQSDGAFLNESQMEKGYVLTCVSYPTSDRLIHSHKESEYLHWSYVGLVLRTFALVLVYWDQTESIVCGDTGRIFAQNSTTSAEGQEREVECNNWYFSARRHATIGVLIYCVERLKI